MRLVEGAIFLSLATGLHMGLWAAAPAPDGATPSGDNGREEITITPASAGMTQMVRAWQSPPQVATDLNATTAPETATPVALPAPVAPAPKMALPGRPALPDHGSAPQAEETPPTAPRTPPVTALAQPAAPEASQPPAPDARPQARPRPAPAPRLQAPDTAALPRADTQPATPQPKARAQGAPQKKPSAGAASGTQQAAATQSAQSATLQAQWGARIQRKVHRSLFYPRGASGSGTARVALTVDRNGRLQGLTLIRSSGVAAFDDAALSAVRRAGRFPKAPDGLGEASYRFTMGLNFKP
ncbi:energy transducer TonB [Aestuariivita boseongensis]|uniref:energy transducer TonB n=1 Tax=Aestuariivita boseongensis TaxID=1470562 RepID=UPI000681E0D2|nr:energy transducer TonB [Aestuariivita boseongensis]